jgi:CDP-paratose 2-epimerase
VKVFISGVCGFVGSELALGLLAGGYEVEGCDNFIRPGSELNESRLSAAGAKVWYGDVRREKDLARIRGADWIIDAAANPSILAGLEGKISSRELLEHNLWGTVNLLEVCRRESAGMILLSTSRVYSIPELLSLPVTVVDDGFVLLKNTTSAGPHGLREEFPTSPPVSLYGASKLSSECLALEYGCTYGFPVWVNRCGVMSGARQFGQSDQGIFSYWIHSWSEKNPLKYIGFGGAGHQVRDCLHPQDLLQLLIKQMTSPSKTNDKIFNVGGGLASAMSLRQLSRWCASEFGDGEVKSDPAPRPFDVPWVVLDSSKAESIWGWKPQRSVDGICSEIAHHARENPQWLSVSSGDRS